MLLHRSLMIWAYHGFSLALTEADQESGPFLELIDSMSFTDLIVEEVGF